MVVPTLTYGSELSTVTKKKHEAKNESGWMTFLRSVAGDTRKDQVRNMKIMEELNILKLNNKIHTKTVISHSTNGRYTNFKGDFNIQTKTTTKHRTPTFKMQGPKLKEDGTGRTGPNA
jgi:hypothetical protein